MKLYYAILYIIIYIYNYYIIKKQKLEYCIHSVCQLNLPLKDDMFDWLHRISNVSWLICIITQLCCKVHWDQIITNNVICSDRGYNTNTKPSPSAVCIVSNCINATFGTKRNTWPTWITANMNDTTKSRRSVVTCASIPLLTPHSF